MISHFAGFRQSLINFAGGEGVKAADLTTVVGGEFWLIRAIYKLEGTRSPFAKALGTSRAPRISPAGKPWRLAEWSASQPMVQPCGP